MSEFTEVRVKLENLDSKVGEIKAQLNDDRAEWRRVADQLAQIAGSLQVLLGDRQQHQKTIERIHERHDEQDKRLKSAEQKIAVLENAQVSGKESHTSLRSIMWDIGRLIAAAIVAAIAATRIGGGAS